ncbi:MAG TPA: SigE family RNA polymerase sigma factor [Jatrophihabitantaceae bacterium]|nr:SigE family RNA polymerase sigma factor [Jatrophihabitantaceae bacterium]
MRFETYVEQRRQSLFRFAVVLCGEPVLAEDIVTDVLGRAYEQWDRVGAADNVHAYVRRMIVNEYIGWWRRLKRTTPVAEPELAAAPDHADHHAERAAVVAELAKLPRKQRAVLVLRFYEGMSDDEVAQVLGCRPSTVRSNASRALANLRIGMTELTTTPVEA